MTPPRNLRASTPLLIDGHAVGNADINRRVVIRAYAPCLAWKTIFHAGDNSCRPVRPLLRLVPSFLPSSSSRYICIYFFSLALFLAFFLSLSCSRLLLLLFFFLCQTSFFFTYGFLRRRPSRLRHKLRQVCLIEAPISVNALKFTSLPLFLLLLTYLFYSHAFEVF